MSHKNKAKRPLGTPLNVLAKEKKFMYTGTCQQEIVKKQNTKTKPTNQTKTLQNTLLWDKDF